jgi:hypothetical protein
MNIDDPTKFNLKPDLLTLSFYDNNIEDLSLIE